MFSKWTYVFFSKSTKKKLSEEEAPATIGFINRRGEDFWTPNTSNKTAIEKYGRTPLENLFKYNYKNAIIVVAWK